MKWFSNWSQRRYNTLTSRNFKNRFVPVGYHHWFQLSVYVQNENSNVLSQASPHLNVYLALCIFPWRGKIFSNGVNRHSTTSATLFWNYHFTYIQIIFILPLCTFHILRICDEYHHFPLTRRSHSNWPHEFGLRWLMLVRLYVISQHHNWGEMLTARFAYSLIQHFLNRRTIEIIWNWRKDWSGTMRYISHSQTKCHKQWWKPVRSSGRRSLRNSEALACLCGRQRRRKKSVL